MAEKKVVVKKSEPKKNLSWAGSLTLMGQVTPGSKEAKERALIKLTSEALQVSPFGVNLLGSVPYINKLGLGQKSEQIGKGKDEFRYNWVQRAMDDTQKAICECKIVREGKDITDWVTGECSPVTMKMGTLKGYQNHMAQTRAKNRAILEAYGVKIHTGMIERIGYLLDQKKITEKQANALTETAGKATSSSVEEVELDKSTKVAPLNNDLFTYEQASPDANQEFKNVKTCSKCDGIVTPEEEKFSMKMYGKILKNIKKKLMKTKKRTTIRKNDENTKKKSKRFMVLPKQAFIYPFKPKTST
jgi:hypothetical protein